MLEAGPQLVRSQPGRMKLTREQVLEREVGGGVGGEIEAETERYPMVFKFPSYFLSLAHLLLPFFFVI